MGFSVGIDSPKVTVIIPVFNGERYLGEAIESILRQTYRNFELLIINDGSTDQSSAIISSYSNERIRVINNPMNYGLTKTRNIGLREARGEYIAMLDCDDIALPRRLEEQIDVMERMPELGLLGTWVEVKNEGGSFREGIYKYQLPPERIPINMLFMNYFAQSSVIMRKTALPQDGYRDDFPMAEDYDLFVRIAKTWKVWNVQKPLILYRSHTSNVSSLKREVMEKCVRRIIVDQLARLEIFPTAHEISIHRRIGLHEPVTDTKELDEIEAWLTKLIEANLKLNNYPHPLFKDIIGEWWCKACNCATELGWVSWSRFMTSPLSKYGDISFWKKLKLAVKCVMKRGMKAR